MGWCDAVELRMPSHIDSYPFDVRVFQLYGDTASYTRTLSPSPWLVMRNICKLCNPFEMPLLLHCSHRPRWPLFSQNNSELVSMPRLFTLHANTVDSKREYEIRRWDAVATCRLFGLQTNAGEEAAWAIMHFLNRKTNFQIIDVVVCVCGVCARDQSVWTLSTYGTVDAQPSWSAICKINWNVNNMLTIRPK